MAYELPPPPSNAQAGSFAWYDWYTKLRDYVLNIKVGAHNDLTGIQGGTTGEYYHLTSAQNTTVGTLTSGVYTPTLTNVANLTASAAYNAQYMRVGNVVTVSGMVDVDPTLTSTSTQLGISLPIASELVVQEDCCGTAAAANLSGQVAAIHGDATNNRAVMRWLSGDTTGQQMYYIFTYRIR